MNQEDFDAIHEARQKALSLTGAIVLYIPDPCSGSHPVVGLSALPLIWINTETRPDIADLPRVHQIEGAGTIETSWVFDYYQPDGSVTFYFRCRLRTPVGAAFIVAFPLPQSEEILAQIIACKELLLFTSSPPSWLPDGPRTNEQPRSWIARLQVVQRPLLLSPSARSELNQGLHLSLKHPDLAEAFNFWVYLHTIHRRTAEK